MKRSGKMILLLLVAVALCGGYLAVQHFSQKETVEAEDVQISLLNAEADDVTGLAWETDGEAVTLKKQDGLWRLDGDDAFPVDQDAAQQLANSVANLTANRRLTGVETLSDYGLEQPTFAVTVTLADGDWHLISQGSINALSGDAYVQVSGDSDVYITSDAPADAFDLGREDLLAMEPLPEIADAMQLDLSTPERTQTLRYVASGADSFEDAETGRPMDADAISTFVDTLNAIAWTGCVSYDAGDDARTQFGLDEPTAQVRVRYTTETASDADDGETTVEEGEYTLLLGGASSDDGSVYAATSADSPMIYTISSADAQAIYDAIDGGLESNRVFFADWDDVTTVRATAGDMQLTITRAEPTATDTPETADDPETAAEPEEAAAASDSGWQVNGQTVDEALWNRLTDALDALESAEADADGAGDAILTIGIEQADGTTQRVTFLDGLDSYAIQGEPRTVDAAKTDEILRILRHLTK